MVAPGAVAVSEVPLVATEAREPARRRLDSVDLLRGVVMVVMALDHVRDYFTRLCRWFAGVKERRRDAWLSYL